MDEHPFSLWLYYIIEKSGKLLYLQHLVFGNMKGPQLGCFFVLVLFHALEDVGQDGDGFDDVRAFIEHDTFRPFAHGGVSDFRP